MARFHPAYIRRSDGKLEIVSRAGKLRETNEPTTDQLDQKPNRDGVSDYYRQVTPDEMKHLDWRRKLGGMLARELRLQDTAVMLVDFPENYRLYEHVKRTDKDGKTEVKTKMHAGGGNDRQDAYLYGHPLGRRKRFRSPADFFPHLLWLATDETGDHDNCGCKVCSPEDLEGIVPGAKAAKPASRPESVAKSPAAQDMMRQSSTQSLQQRAASAPKSTSPRPNPLPAATRAEQRDDQIYNMYVYRLGEVVWFRKDAAWGLGLVLSRWKSDSRSSYTVQPLSNPPGGPHERYSIAVTRSNDNEMRPWLAWSVPQYTHPGLNNMSDPMTFENADWDGMRQGRYGAGGDMNVDGSILAAKGVDASYTPLHPIRTVPSPSNSSATETHYTALYLGAEKVWLGDPIRLSTGTDVVILHSIVEPQPPTSSSIYLTGDTYTLVTIAHANPDVPTPAAASANPHLSPRLTQDLAERNSRSVSTHRRASYWKLTTPNTRITLDRVKGRWYEASLLLPILQSEEAYEALARRGEISEVGGWMNGRGDASNANRDARLPRLVKADVRYADRRAAFGRSMPAEARVDGESAASPPPARPTQGHGGHMGSALVDPALIDPALAGSGDGTNNANEGLEIDTHFDTAQDALDLPTGANDQMDSIQVNGAGGGGAGIEEFMDLDNMPGFGHDYGSQSQGYYG
nr:hypothetical protein B0A51_06587 [Rachicladosporium sp. CCFEE 5018]